MGMQFFGKGWGLGACLPLLLVLLGGTDALAVGGTDGQNPPQPLQRGVWSENTAPGLLDEGLELYQMGRFVEAARVWERAAVAYAEAGEFLDEAQALNFLASAYASLGEVDRARESNQKALKLLESNQPVANSGIPTVSATRQLNILGQALNVRGQLELSQGQTSQAYATWMEAETAYTSAGDETGKYGAQLNQAQALQFLGQYRRARTLLEAHHQQLHGQEDSLLLAKSLRSLGVALQNSGDLVQSKEILERSWEISSRLRSPGETGATLFAIGNVARDLQQYDVALEYYREVAKLSGDSLTRVQSDLNQLSLLVKMAQWEDAQNLIPELKLRLSELPNGRARIYARLNLAQSLMQRLVVGQKPKPTDVTEVAQILATAVEEAKQLGDTLAQATALTELGNLYEDVGQLGSAQTLTEEALQIAKLVESSDIMARSAWQLGRVNKAQGNVKRAISAYQVAFDALQNLRGDLVAMNPLVQFSFKETVEPLYRELASLLLRPDSTQEELKQARQVLEALQIAELDNFFREACLDTKPVSLDDIDADAATIYPIILPDRVEVILSLPRQPLRHYSTAVPQSQVEATLEELYGSLHPGYSPAEFFRLSRQVYDWLVAPAVADFNGSGITTLVFVPDRFLRNLPMAILHDGSQYLIEKYSLASSPGLQLFPQGIAGEKLNLLAAGLTEARQGFPQLPAVKEELEEIATNVDSSTLYLNQEFTRDKLYSSLKNRSFRVVHLATHGQFSSNAEETFLLTWDGRISLQDFDFLFKQHQLSTQNTIDLLVLSACETASGDDRAALGLAGLALRSGARSTLASLWSVSDEATAALMSEFYRQLAGADITKAEALRLAQLSLLQQPRYSHPYFWSAFILLGNWL
ncbi:MAG TPA: CHAT domain-containing protein [Oscillatoriaceae cyanobacterium M33_DOE_052]|uniref:CHAT domain-containing protein n=1 Tax=Planktothricoides sp. SpSt-374 TaxID=2282167 RepID=A0A7C3VHN2_9CYAN|nr:CHAT domain-containing protein [Oscillatoriaceae cyanobacterium M33_DOE_052]